MQYDLFNIIWIVKAKCREKYKFTALFLYAHLAYSFKSKEVTKIDPKQAESRKSLLFSLSMIFNGQMVNLWTCLVTF